VVPPARPLFSTVTDPATAARRDTAVRLGLYLARAVGHPNPITSFQAFQALHTHLTWADRTAVAELVRRLRPPRLTHRSTP
jgi:hypothetical protein